MRLLGWRRWEFVFLFPAIFWFVQPAPAQVRSASYEVAAAADVKIAESYGKLPLRFEANQGQTDSRVQFLSRGSGYTLFLTPTEAVLTLRQGKETGVRSQESEDDSAVLRMKLVGANPASRATGLVEMPGKSNYFIGNDPNEWRKNVPNYAKVRYEEVYPGVDLVYYGNQRQLEYDFVVAPGADLRAIRLDFEGAQRVEIDPQGDLVLHTGAGEVRQHKPIVYQEVAGAIKAVDGHYVRKGEKAVGFEVASYDARHPLIIDPVLVYSTYLGGSGSDDGNGIAVDSSGSAYVVGNTASTNFPTASPLQASSGGGNDVFVVKLNPTGSALVYSTYLGGSNSDFGDSIAVDASGNAYVTGETSSTNFPTASPLQAAFGGSSDAFVAKLNASGSALVYSTYLGGSFSDAGNGIAVDSSGNAYVTGETSSTNFPTVNPFQATYVSGGDAFVAKLNASGNALVYSTYLGGGGDDRGLGITVDSSGNGYVAGRTTSTNFPTANALQAAFGGTGDAFVAKLNASGSALVYSTYLGGSSSDFGNSNSIAVDSAGNAYVTGLTASTNFPTASPLQAASGGGQDAFVAKLNSAGSALIYSTYLGSGGNEAGQGIAVDSSGNAYVVGGTISTNFPTISPFQAANGGSIDVFVTKLNAAGSALVYSTYLGGSGNEAGRGIAVDSSGNAYLTGQTQSADFPTANPAQASFGGGTFDAFVAKIGEVAAPPVISGCPISGSTGAQGVFDSTNRDSGNGVAWPANAAFAFTDLDTGLVTFFDSAGDQIPSASGFPNPASLPGFSGAEDGFHFTSVHLESGKQAAFTTSSSGLSPAIILRSCQDVILDTGSSFSWGFDPDTMNALPAGFLGGSGANTVSEGFGPRSGSLPASGFLYPAIGGGGGKGGGTFDGGRGGPAFVISASQRITVNGTIFANGLDAEQGASATQQGGGGGSVRLGAVLIEGTGSINTAGGTGPGGNGAAGPIAVQAFLQDLFTGSTTATPSRSNAVVAPIPDNLPVIEISSVGAVALEFSDSGFPNSGSLSEPDVTLPTPGSPVDVNVGVFTVGIPLGTSLRYRAVGTDGSVVTTLGSVVSCDCLPGEGIASGDLTLNPGVTYQIVVYPETPFALARGGIAPQPLGEPVLYATSREDRETEGKQSEMIPEQEISSPLEKWARAFGAEPQAHKKLAQLHLSKQETQR